DGAVVPAQRVYLFAVPVPNLDGVIEAARGQEVGLRVERQGDDRALVPLERACDLAFGEVPQVDDAVAAAARQRFAVARECHRADPAVMALERGGRLCRRPSAGEE